MNEQNVKTTHKRPLLRTLALLFAVLLPFILMIIAPFALPDVYGDTFLGELSPKLERLRTVEGDKLVVVGGSSVAFGLDSALLEEYTGYNVVNFGLYATLGTRLMLDLSLPEIEEGDVVIIAPELDPQTLSMYFNGEAAWQAADSDLSLLFDVHPDNFTDMLLSYPDYLSVALSRFFSGDGKFDPDGVYRRDSFNEYGDISYPREHNVMAAGYDVNQPVSLTPELFEPEFIDYLNGYIDEAQKKGATVYYTFSPVNRSALTEETDAAAIEEFYRFVAASLHCPVISDVNSLLMHEDYFYDTNFHLNDAGATVRTANLIADLRREWGNTEPLDIELPAPPQKPAPDEGDGWEENEWSGRYVYENFGGGLMIVGVTEEAKSLAKLEIPYKAEGKVVLAIAENAFSGYDSLTDVTIYENLSVIKDGAFSGAPALENLHIMHSNADGLTVGDALFDGAPDDLQICLHTDESYQNFVSGYWWGVHSHRMVKISD